LPKTEALLAFGIASGKVPCHARWAVTRSARLHRGGRLLDWPGLAQIARLERKREVRGRESAETVYLITSLPPDEATPERLMDLARAGARPLAAPRNLAMTLIRKTAIPIPEARENYREDRNSAINAVTQAFFE